jgi:hypothetical protein
MKIRHQTRVLLAGVLQKLQPISQRERCAGREAQHVAQSRLFTNVGSRELLEQSRLPLEHDCLPLDE